VNESIAVTESDQPAGRSLGRSGYLAGWPWDPDISNDIETLTFPAEEPRSLHVCEEYHTAFRGASGQQHRAPPRPGAAAFAWAPHL